MLYLPGVQAFCSLSGCGAGPDAEPRDEFSIEGAAESSNSCMRESDSNLPLLELDAPIVQSNPRLGEDLLEVLPPLISLVCIADSCEVPKAMGLEKLAAADRELRFVEIIISVAASKDPGASPDQELCTSAMLRAAGALSLADGPCSLSCHAFFNEVADQAHDIAAAASVPLLAVRLSAQPAEDLAAVVRWPLAARPRNQTVAPASPAASAEQPSPSRPSPEPAGPPALPARELYFQPVPELPRKLLAQRTDPDGARRNGRSVPRPMPTDFGSLSLMLTGGDKLTAKPKLARAASNGDPKLARAASGGGGPQLARAASGGERRNKSFGSRKPKAKIVAVPQWSSPELV